MKEDKIKALPVVKAYSDYFVRRAKRIFKLKNKEFEIVHVDLFDLKYVEVWFFAETKIVAHAKFMSNGRLIDTMDNRLGRKIKKEEN